MIRRLTIFADAAIEQWQGGLASCAFIVFEGKVDGREGADRPDPIAQKYSCIGNFVACQLTNNVAEYRALIGALKWVLKYAPNDEIIIYTDSQLVHRQIIGVYQCNHDHLMTYLIQARELCSQLPNVQIEWIRREFNYVADQLTKLALAEAKQNGTIKTR